MSDKKHIDRIFQERFKNFEATPDDAVWRNIKSRLKEDDDDDKVIPVWWRFAGVAALLLLLLTVGGLIFSDDFAASTSNIVVDTEESIPLNSDKENNANIINTPNVNDIDTSQNKVVSINGNVSEIENQNSTNANSSDKTLKEDVLVANTSSINNNVSESTSTKQINNNSLSKKQKREEDAILIPINPINNNPVAETSSVKEDKKPAKAINNNDATININTQSLDQLQNSNSALANTTKNTGNLNSETEFSPIQKSSTETSNALVENTSIDDESVEILELENIIASDSLSIEDEIAKVDNIMEEEKTINRWSISPNVAPVYFNTLGKGSSIGAQFNNNSKSSELNMSYGIAGSYAINDKLVVRAGINKLNLGYNTNNVLALETTGRGPNLALLSNIKTDNNNPDMSFVSANSVVLSRTSNVIDINDVGFINQSIGYIEIPVELQYSLLNKKFGVNVIGGFSSFFLNDNELTSSINGNTTNIGEANNINDVSYSANFGLGLNYSFAKNLNFNLEPILKYQINTFSNTSGDFKPYFIGFYTGFSFKF